MTDRLKQTTRRQLLQTPALAAAAALAGPRGIADAAPNTTVKMVRAGDAIEFRSGAALVCTLPGAPGAGFGEIRGDAISRRFRLGIWAVEDRLRRTAPDLFEWRRSWRNTSAQPAAGDFLAEAETGYAPEFTLLPAVSHDGNKERSGAAPKGLEANGEPFVFSGYRTSVPGGTYSEGAGWSVFLFASGTHPSMDCGCSLARAGDRMAHRLVWPERESAGVRRGGAGYREALEIAPGQSFEVVAYLAPRPVAEARREWAAGLDHAWRMNRRALRASFPTKRQWALACQFARESLWHEQPGYTGFLTGAGHWDVTKAGEYKDGRFVWGSPMQAEIGWVGQFAAIGAALLQDYLWNKNPKSRELAERALDFWADNYRLKCGLFYTHYDMKAGLQGWGAHNANFLGRPMKPGEKRYLDTCNLGHGMYQYLLASELAAQCGAPKPLWRRTALDACNFFLEHPLKDGTFGKAWSVDGECLSEESTCGAFVLWAMLKAYRTTRDARYLEASKRAFRTYSERDLHRLQCWGGAIDVNCIDKESCWPVLMSALDLYEITGEKQYLRDAELAGSYLASFQVSYSVPFQPESPLGRMNYDTFGGTNISVQGTGQDPWGALITLGWLRLAKATGKPIWRDRALIGWAQASIGVSDGTLVVKGLQRPPGSQNEVYGYGVGAHNGKAFFGEANQWLPAWPAVFRLVTLMHWGRWRDLEA